MLRQLEKHGSTRLRISGSRRGGAPALKPDDAAASLAARILPLGDSLTLGVQGQGGGYRSPLGAALKGYSTPYSVGFVGGLYLAGSCERESRHANAPYYVSLVIFHTKYNKGRL